MPIAPALLHLDADAISALAASGESPSPLTGTAALVVALDACAALDDDIATAGWLGSVGCPVVGLGEARSAPRLSAACDVLASDDGELETLARGIRSAPLAAATAVQLLRAIDGQANVPALHAESLAYAALQSGPEYCAWLAARGRTEPVVTDEGPAVRMQRQKEHLHLRLNRASRRNAMSVEMRDALCEAMALVRSDTSITRVSLDALGPCFSTGGDLDEFGHVPDPVSGHLVRGLALPGRMLADCPARVSVQVHGACVGSGIEFPAFAGHITARADASFQLPELGFGLIPGAGGCVSIPRRIGRQRTARMLLGGARIDATTALAWGLVDAIE